MKITQYTTILNEEKHCCLVKEKAVLYQEQTKLNGPDKIYRMLCDVFQHNRQSEEYLYLLCFTKAMKLLGVFELSHGTVDCTLCNPREIFLKALLCNATSIVLAHNHPSGELAPSKDDFTVYERVKNASQIMGISLIDNIIVGDNGYYSFSENN